MVLSFMFYLNYISLDIEQTIPLPPLDIMETVRNHVPNFVQL
jgi:hypothetical protein